MAEIFSGLAIVGGGLFALVQFVEHRKLRRYQVAAELGRQFSDPELARAVNLIRQLPDGVTADGMRELGPQYEESAQIVAMAFETMGLLVHKNLASFQLIQELTGGLLLTMWRKLETWVKSTRVESGNSRFAEWVQWLAERIAAEERSMVPAYEAYANWRGPGR